MPQFLFGAFEVVVARAAPVFAEEDAEPEPAIADLGTAGGLFIDDDGGEGVFAEGERVVFLLVVEEAVGRDLVVLEDSAPLSPWERGWKMRL